MITGVWRRVVGLSLLGTVVFLWTASGFLASSIFADASYSKPFFVTYFNNSLFNLFFIVYFSQRKYRNYRERQSLREEGKSPISYSTFSDQDDQNRESTDSLDRRSSNEQRFHALEAGSSRGPQPTGILLPPTTSLPKLTVRETFWLSMKFGLLWFFSNYFNSGALQFTSVSSTMILSGTSSVFTLILGVIFKVERFTWGKFIAVLTCLLGITIISRADLSGKNGSEGKFPHKLPSDMAVGDLMALTAALFYGIYATFLVRSVKDESRIDMPLFFGFIGLITMVLYWPGIAIFDWAGFEQFCLPPDGRTWGVVITNAAASIVADFAWAYSLLFISPVVVTVGLSMTTPLSLIGQMLINQQYASVLYWIGATIVVCAFIALNIQTMPTAPVESDEDES